MPTVRTSVVIPDVDIHHVWDTVCDFEKHPLHMVDVLEIRYLERTAEQALSSWRVLLNGSELTWTERDFFSPPNRIDFDQTEGDLEVFRGSWELEQCGTGIKVTLEIEFDLGIPSLAAVLDPVGVQAIRSNSSSMLTAISERRPLPATL
ncbi:type II toxin-antitoxin system RatA family toxin [Kitasatospora sp. NBC_01266]|uniref:type II toxin-antitoxin system RatA family toxin n=1 Tax=Kitasatospora sp. NBC_01266 TaxID=2903572 RepID=UPI002E33D654|nr:SRPBCC family protein [Kitasatospora sp. NBC_01266]